MILSTYILFRIQICVVTSHCSIIKSFKTEKIKFKAQNSEVFLYVIEVYVSQHAIGVLFAAYQNLNLCQFKKKYLDDKLWIFKMPTHRYVNADPQICVNALDPKSHRYLPPLKEDCSDSFFTTLVTSILCFTISSRTIFQMNMFSC